MIAPGAVNLHHVRVIDRRGDRRLFLKLRDKLGIPAVLALEKFQRDLPIEIRVERAIDRAHAAGAELLLDFKVIELPPHPHGRAAGRAMHERKGLLPGNIDQRAAGGAFLNDGVGRAGHVRAARYHLKNPSARDAPESEKFFIRREYGRMLSRRLTGPSAPATLPLARPE